MPHSIYERQYLCYCIIIFHLNLAGMVDSRIYLISN